jgi:hypothetical protein
VSISGLGAYSSVLANREPARPGPAGRDAGGGTLGSYTSHPNRHRRPLVQRPVPRAVRGGSVRWRRRGRRIRPMPMANSGLTQMGAGGPPAVIPTPLQLDRSAHTISGDTDQDSGTGAPGPSRPPSCHCIGLCCGMARPLWCAPHEEAARQGGCYLGDMRSFLCMN